MSELKLLSFKQDYKVFLDSSFYTRLRKIKLHEQKLESNLIKLPGTKINYVTKTITLTDSSFDEDNNNDIVLGSVKNFNTIEEFKKLDKIAYLKEVSSRTEYEKYFFHLICFADLKKFSLVYWVCIPSLSVKGLEFSIEHLSNQDSDIELQKGELFTISGNNTLICNHNLFKFISYDSKIVASTFLKNILIKQIIRHQVNEVTIILTGGLDTEKTFFKITTFSERPNISNLDIIFKGWEKNSDNKLIPKFINFSSLLDPVQLNEQNVTLNLELMKWRINPDLNLKILQKQRILLLGAGTLGCYISRCLLGWGIYNIAFVDDGEISHSNPVRQPLFNFEDVGNGKAETASKNLKKIYPLCEAKFEKMKVPMIGHLETVEKDLYLKLEKLIKESDVVFLLMDSREARWLPSVIAKAENKTVLTTAIGYDNYVVMQHGNFAEKTKHLGCYFCSDVLAPMDSLKDRTLDQMCTVTRPGCAMMASSVAVELLVTYLQSFEQPNKIVENQIRGSLDNFTISRNTMENYKYCSACSENVIGEYKSQKWEFVKKALKNPKHVEDISGLTAVHLETEKLLLDMEQLGL
ncbi:hypothetical protein QEN19_002431 [Hanseniaspora menglaensis]